MFIEMLAMFVLLLLVAFICSLPLYLCVNFILFVFGLSYRITMIQAISLSLVLSVIKSLYFTKGE